jgi:hypothetical protein
VLILYERISEHKYDIDEREDVGLESNRSQKNQHDDSLEDKHHSFGETDLVFHRHGLLQNVFKLFCFIFFKNINVFVSIFNVNLRNLFFNSVLNFCFFIQ